MQEKYEALFVVRNAWIFDKKQDGIIIGDVTNKDNETVYSCRLDVSLLSPWKVIEMEAGASFSVIVVAIRKQEEVDEDYEVKSVDINLSENTESVINHLRVNPSKPNVVRGKINISAANMPAIRCDVSITFNKGGVRLSEQFEDADGLRAQVSFRKDAKFPFDVKQLLNAYVKRKDIYPRLSFPAVHSVPEDGFKSVAVHYGPLSVSMPLEGKDWTDFQRLLDKYRIRLDIKSIQNFFVPFSYKLIINKYETFRLALNEKVLKGALRKVLVCAIEEDTSAKKTSTWFRIDHLNIDISLQHNEMMLHGFRKFKPMQKVEFWLEYVKEVQKRDKKAGNETFFNYDNLWRINHVAIDPEIITSLNKERLTGRTLFNWSFLNSEHDLDEDHNKRLVKATQLQLWIGIDLKDFATLAVQVSPAIVKKYTRIPEGSEVTLTLCVAQRNEFKGVSKCGYFEMWCDGIAIDVPEFRPKESVTKRLRIEKVTKALTKEQKLQWQIEFSDPEDASLVVKYFKPLEENLGAFNVMDFTGRYCQVSATKVNKTLTVNKIELVEM